MYFSIKNVQHFSQCKKNFNFIYVIPLNASICALFSPLLLFFVFFSFFSFFALHLLLAFTRSVHSFYLFIFIYTYLYVQRVGTRYNIYFVFGWGWFFSSCTKWIPNIMNKTWMKRTAKRAVLKAVTVWRVVKWKKQNVVYMLSKPSLLTIHTRCVADIINIRRQTQTHHNHNKLYGHELTFFFFSSFCFTYFAGRLRANAVFYSHEICFFFLYLFILNFPLAFLLYVWSCACAAWANIRYLMER